VLASRSITLGHWVTPCFGQFGLALRRIELGAASGDERKAAARASIQYRLACREGMG